jgi:hypothetical protein
MTLRKAFVLNATFAVVTVTAGVLTFVQIF